jgi:adenine-specific DNA-methyltransferase
MSNDLISNYIIKTVPTYQKLRGGYYTPRIISRFLAEWAIQSSTATVLEPSCGDGNILEAAAEALISRGATPKAISQNLHGVEIDQTEAQKAADRLRALGIPPDSSQIEVADFFAYCKQHLRDKRLFDVVIGNPPFIRYQHFLEEHRDPAFDLMARAGLKANRLTNAWVPFLLASSLLLNESGRLAMVIPAELLQVKYAASLRQFISDYFKRVTLITFRSLVFDDIQQEVILLLGERGAGKHAGIRTIELDDINDLDDYDHTLAAASEVKPMDHSSEKWTQYFLDTSEIELLRELRGNPNLTPSGQVIDVDVGVVTGLNKYFVLTQEQVEENRLEKYTQRIVGRSGHLGGIVFSEDDWKNNTQSQYASFLLVPPDVPFERLPQRLKDYVLKGEKEGVHKGYKCSIRNHWYIVPSVWVPDAFLLRQVHGYPKLIVNESGATCTDTIHRVRFRNGHKGQNVAAAFVNSLTFAFSEVVGRSYGGGVLELEPNEAEDIPLPLENMKMLDAKEIHTLLLQDKVEAALDITDRHLLVEGIGLSRKEAKAVRNIWKTLRDRRINRKRKKA